MNLGKWIFFMQAILLLASCLSQNTPTSATEAAVVSQEKPDWLLSPPNGESDIYGVGFHIDLDQAKQRAMINTAQQFSSRVTSVLEEQNYSDDQESRRMVRSMTEQVSEMTLHGAKYADHYQDEAGVNWVLVKAPLDCMLDVTEGVLLSYQLDVDIHGQQVIQLVNQLEQAVDEQWTYFYEAAPEDFVRVEAGSFIMGSREVEGDPGYGYDELLHPVSFTYDYFISKYEVTQELWQEIMGNNPSDGERGIIDPQVPVNRISFMEAVEFCNRLSLRDGLEPAYTGRGINVQCNFNASGYRLPSEAEWEYAARGGQRNVVYTSYAGSDDPDRVGWFDHNSDQEIHRVGLKEPNELGLYDMSGNVYEWCWDRYGDYPESAEDYFGPERGTLRVRRGGSWGFDSLNGSMADRGRGNPEDRGVNLGFRVVRMPLAY